MGVQRTTLPGGLRVVTEFVPGVRSASVGVWVGVGSRDEGPSVAGAAHFLEHLLFKSTPTRTALEIAKLLTKPIMRDGTMTFGEFFSSIITDLGLKVRRNQSEMKQQDNMIQQFKEIRSSISSVNMDEELTNMVQYQKAYEASARFLGTVDEMMETVINMK